MYSKILLTLDGSDLSRQAIPHAAAVAQATGSEVVVLQVIDSEVQILSQTAGVTIEPVPMGRISAEVARDAVEAQRRAAEANLDAARAALAEQGASKVSLEIREGTPGETIVEAVQELGIDVLVIATHGRSGLRRVLLGSIADHVLRHAPSTPVLLVRPQSR